MVVRYMADVLEKSIFQNWNLRRMVSTQNFFYIWVLKLKIISFLIILYDKRDDFFFYVDRILYLRSNILSKILYSAFGDKIL